MTFILFKKHHTQKLDTVNFHEIVIKSLELKNNITFEF